MRPGRHCVFVRFELLAAEMDKVSASDQLGLALAPFLTPWFIASYLTLLWPVFALLPQWWALAAQRPQARRGRRRLVVLGPVAVLAICQKLRLPPDEL